MIVKDDMWLAEAIRFYAANGQTVTLVPTDNKDKDGNTVLEMSVSSNPKFLSDLKSYLEEQIKATLLDAGNNPKRSDECILHFTDGFYCGELNGYKIVYIKFFGEDAYEKYVRSM